MTIHLIEFIYLLDIVASLEHKHNKSYSITLFGSLSIVFRCIETNFVKFEKIIFN